MPKSKIWSVLLLLWLVLFTLPAYGAELTYSGSLEEIAQPVTLARIGVARIRSGVLPGVVIGGHHEGALKIRQQEYRASGNLDEQLEAATHRVVEAELVKAGYAVTPSSLSSIFGEQLAQEEEPTRFLIGGTITGVALNTYGSWFSSKTEEERTIRWEVLDRETHRVIATQETTGKAQAPGIDNLAATYAAVQASFQAFLTSPTLTQQLQRAAQALPGLPERSDYEIAALPSSTVPLSTQQIAQQTVPAMAWIQTLTGRGSGFLINPAGLLITNQHVVGDALSVTVNLYDGSTQTARVLRRDAETDVALLQMPQAVPGVSGLSVCYGDAVKVGEEVVAIGNPLSFANTVTQGIISGVRRNGSRNLIQTDVAINPGNSGGPLLNRQGAVIGIVTEKVASRGIEGLGFAVPIGESLRQLGVQVKPQSELALDRCGNPTA